MLTSKYALESLLLKTDGHIVSMSALACRLTVHLLNTR